MMQSVFDLLFLTTGVQREPLPHCSLGHAWDWHGDRSAFVKVPLKELKTYRRWYCLVSSLNFLKNFPGANSTQHKGLLQSYHNCGTSHCIWHFQYRSRTAIAHQFKNRKKEISMTELIFSFLTCSLLVSIVLWERLPKIVHLQWVKFGFTVMEESA